MTYAEKLKDPRWQKKRLQILERDKWRCQHCFDSQETLHVHHSEYSKGIAPWDYDDSLLVTLCEACHEQVEALKTKLGKIVSDPRGVDLCLRFCAVHERLGEDLCRVMLNMASHPKLFLEISNGLDEFYEAGRKSNEHDPEPQDAA